MEQTMGEIIRRLRRERDLTQEELAEQIGVTSQAVSKWENNTGMPDISQIVPLANLFGVSTDTLFNYCCADRRHEIEGYSKSTKNYKESEFELLLERMEDGCFDFVRDDPQFQAILQG